MGRTLHLKSLALAALAAVAMTGHPAAAGTSSTTLADLVMGGTLVVDGVTYSNFQASVKGDGLSADLSDYIVNAAMGGGFTVELATGLRESKSGKLTLDYTVSDSQLVMASLQLTAIDADAKLKVKQKLRADKKLGSLSIKEKDGTAIESLEFDPVSSFDVSSKIKTKRGGSTFRTNVEVSIIPEPATGLLTALGITLLALRRRRA